MAESLNENVEKLQEESNNKQHQLNFLIQQLVELKEEINKYKGKRYYWESQFSALSMNIWAEQIKYSETQKKEIHLREAMSEMMKISDLKQQELRNLRVQRMETFSKQCNNFRNNCANYTDNFLHAQTQYSIENISKDLEQYQQEYNKIQHEILLQSKELENLETLQNFTYLNSDGNTQEMLITNIPRVNNDNKLKKIESAQHMFENLKSKVKQKQIVRNNYHE
ncbi:uncharacterized protein LOC143154214 [Ptiloglossa arizonensis]|uniref:uncharacterized protein LOC143154214 n=1 Tax=Ptiloglossa arizonensis TaxID=3350558 RepID=UPI003FA0F296